MSPDTSFSKAALHYSLLPKQLDTVSVLLEFDHFFKGATVFVFDASYVNRHLGYDLDTPPSSYLHEDSALAKYHYSRKQIERANWTLTFPARAEERER